MIQSAPQHIKPKYKHQWWWFIGLYVISVLVVAGIISLLKVLILHSLRGY